MEYLGIHYDTAIEHHGIKGQKWGVRRYQNSDGTLTERGKKRYAKVSSSARLQKAETKKAVKVAKSEASESSRMALAYDKAYRKAMDRGKTQTAEKYSRMASTYVERWKRANKLIKDIENGTKKAGRDFITSSKTTVLPIVTPAFSAFRMSRNTTIVERKR